MSKKIKYLLTMLGVVFAMVAVCGCGDDKEEKAAREEAEREAYSKDIVALDSLKTAVMTYVCEPSSSYKDGKTYTLTEMIKIDKANIIKAVLAEAFNIKGNSGSFNASSKAFKGTTTDDVLISIDNGAVSIYVPSQVEGYNDYVVGNGKDLAN